MEGWQKEVVCSFSAAPQGDVQNSVPKGAPECPWVAVEQCPKRGK